MPEKRKDSKGRVLKDGESQRANGTYDYRYTDIHKKRRCIYAKSLTELRKKEEELWRDLALTGERNFQSNRFPIFDMGKKSGIGDIEMPDFINMAPQVAVQPGNGYVICDVDDILEFEESGQLAIAESASVYRVFVDSWIQRGDSITGANVRFLLGKPSEGQLPVWGTSLGTIWLDPYLASIDEQTPLVVDLPSSHLGDIEIDLLGKAQEELTYAVEGKQLKLRAASLYSVGSEYHLIIRYKHIYTEVSVWVEWKE